MKIFFLIRNKDHQLSKTNEASYHYVMSACIDLELAIQQKDVKKFDTDVQLHATDKEFEFFLEISSVSSSNTIVPIN